LINLATEATRKLLFNVKMYHSHIHGSHISGFKHRPASTDEQNLFHIHIPRYMPNNNFFPYRYTYLKLITYLIVKISNMAMWVMDIGHI